MWSPTPEHPIRRLFAGLTEQTFATTLGVADPQLTDYLSELLSRFLHVDWIYRLKNATGRRLEEVADMVYEAEQMPPEGRTRREVHRHIGDFTLFWTGVYPEVLRSGSIAGSVRARFVVDSAGRVDFARLTIVHSDHMVFTRAVETALRRMRYLPAEVGGRPVAQLVEQTFAFELNR